MNGGKVKFHQFIYHLKHGFFSVENIILLAAVGLCMLWTYQSINSMTRNWQLQEQLGTGKKQVELLSMEVETAKLENEYYASEEYQELAARKLLNKQLPGEHLVYLPSNSEEAKEKHQNQVPLTDASDVKEYSNPEKWFKFIFPNT